MNKLKFTLSPSLEDKTFGWVIDEIVYETQLIDDDMSLCKQIRDGFFHTNQKKLTSLCQGSAYDRILQVILVYMRREQDWRESQQLKHFIFALKTR